MAVNSRSSLSKKLAGSGRNPPIIMASICQISVSAKFLTEGRILYWLESCRTWGRESTSINPIRSTRTCAAAGKFSTPHGMCLDTRGAEPRIIVADRGNHRIQVYSLEGEYVSHATEGLRAPCTAYIRGEDVVIPDLQGRITILNKENKLIAHLGENEDKGKQGKYPVPPEQWKDGQFTAPHGAAWDSKGDLYVEDWNATGRVNKLKRI